MHDQGYPWGSPSTSISTPPQPPSLNKARPWSSSSCGACFLLPQEKLTGHKQHLTVCKAISLS